MAPFSFNGMVAFRLVVVKALPHGFDPYIITFSLRCECCLYSSQRNESLHSVLPCRADAANTFMLSLQLLLLKDFYDNISKYTILHIVYEY